MDDCQTGWDYVTSKRSATGVNVTVLGDRLEWKAHVTVGVTRERTLTAQWPSVSSICQNVRRFTGDGDCSK